MSKYICIFALIIADPAAIRGVALGTLADYLPLISLKQAPVTGSNLFMLGSGAVS